jgi:PAS domain S-box-containing protein
MSEEAGDLSPAAGQSIQASTASGESNPAALLAEAKAERDMLKRVIDTIPNTGLTLRDRDFRLTFQNAYILRVFGDHVGEKCHTVFGDGDEVCDGCPAALAFEDGQSHTDTRKVTLPDGSAAFWEIVASPIRDADGSIVSCLEVITDVSERREAQEEIERLAKFPAENPNPVLRVSKDGFIQYNNSASVPLLEFWQGGKGGALTGEWLQLVSDAAGDGEPKYAEVEYGGRTVSLSFAPVVESSFVNVYGLDITERKQAEARMRHEKLFTETALDAQLDTFFLFDPATGRALRWNRAFSEISGYTDDEIASLPTPVSYYGPEDLERAAVFTQKVLKEGAGTVELELICKDGHKVPTEYRVAAIMDDSDQPNYLIAIGRDVTGRRQAEEREKTLRKRLARAERLESVGVLAGGIAHDLNNLLCPNVLLPQIILDDLQGVTQEQCECIDSIRENLGAIEQCSLTATETIKDISVLSRSHVQPKAPLDINDAVTQYLKSREFGEIKATSPNLSFRIELDRGDPWISGTRSHVGRLLSNLVRNAALAVEDEGAVTIMTSSVCVENPIVGYELIERGNYVVLEIGDTGVGIEQEALERVFEPFFTTRKQASRAGSGLGLAVVHGIVKNHGGTIDVKTEVGEGTTFRLYFPAVEAAQIRTGASADDVPRGTERILVVDDEPQQVMIARVALARQGYVVSEAANGHEAVARFAQANEAGRESPFDLVVLDMLMEEGFDGLTTYREIIKLYPGQKALIVSGYAGDEGAGEEARALGVDWLTKPYQAADIARAVRGRLDRSM